jgi:hypothetical protein
LKSKKKEEKFENSYKFYKEKIFNIQYYMI